MTGDRFFIRHLYRLAQPAITNRLQPVKTGKPVLRWNWCGCLFLILLAVSGCRVVPPVEIGAFRPSDLVEITSQDASIRLDIRYATTNNFMHRPMYLQPRAFLQRPAAQALARVQRSLEPFGCGLVIYDAYRPWAVTKVFWESVSEAERKIGFVANPKKGSKHNRGCAVDLGLIDLKTGDELEMPSNYDEFSERAFPNYSGGKPEARARRDLLRRVMEAEHFTVEKSEWWHFDYDDWKQYRIQNIPFEKLVNGSKTWTTDDRI